MQLSNLHRLCSQNCFNCFDIPKINLRTHCDIMKIIELEQSYTAKKPPDIQQFIDIHLASFMFS